MQRQLLSGRVLLIYQMPKTGSQTIEATLANRSLPHTLLRLHYLSRQSAAALRRGLRSKRGDAEWRQNVRGQLQATGRVARALRLRRLLVACGAKIPPLDVITAVRDVIGVALSSVCENYAFFVANPEELTANVCRKALLHPKTLPPIHDWFDRELKALTGIDVFACPFPSEAGHAVYRNRFARVLLYRFDTLPRLSAALESFLGCPIDRLDNRNRGEAKSYGPIYRQIKAHLRLPADFVTSQLDTKLMRHFYSWSERARLHLQWSEPQLRTQLSVV